MKKSILRSLLGLFLIICLAAAIQPAGAIVHAAPLADGAYSIAVDSSAKSGIAGSIVTYTFTITNNTTDLLTISIDTPVSVSGWDPAPSVDQSSLNVDASGTASFTMDVPIPAAATSGQNDIERVTVSDGSTSTTSSVTTTVKATTVTGRPVLMIADYYLNSGKIAAGYDFELAVKLKNTGGSAAYNIVVAFDGGTAFYPQNTGGIASLNKIEAGSNKTAKQTFTGSSELAGIDVSMIKLTVSYTDSAGTTFSDSFTLTMDVESGGGSGYYATSTPSASNEPRMVVTGYKVDVDPLQPGTTFTLSLDVKNMGNTSATGVTMILGGGGTSASSDSGTPAAGGVSGSGSELTNFAPLNSSNVSFVGNVASGAIVSLSQQLIVNVSTEPGVYTLKLSFVYNDSGGNRIVDDQVITLLVYSLPRIEASFYRDAGEFFVGTPAVLPIQVTNLGKKTNVLGNMTVTAEGETIINGVSLVGSLDPGGYYTLDAELVPSKAGPLDIVVTINYNDDFNQPRQLVQTITINVQEQMIITPDPSLENPEDTGMPGSTDTTMPETFWHKVGRFFKGLFGLDSGEDNQSVTPTEVFPEDSDGYVSPKG